MVLVGGHRKIANPPRLRDNRGVGDKRATISRMSKRQRWIAVFAAACVCALIALFVWDGRHRRRSISQVIVLGEKLVQDEYISAYWRTDDELLIDHEDQGDDYSPRHIWELRNLKTGASKDVVQLHDTLGRVAVMMGPHSGPRCEITPDRHAVRIWWYGRFTCMSLDDTARNQKVVWHELPGTSVPTDDHAPSQNAQTPREKFRGSLSSSQWIYSSDCIGCDEISYLRGDDTGSIESPPSFRLPYGLSTADETTFLGASSEGHIFEYIGSAIPGAVNPSTIAEYVPGSPHPLRSSQMLLPVANLMLVFDWFNRISPRLSPDGTKIVWLSDYTQSPADTPLKAFFRRIHVLPALPDRAIWVSDQLGRNLHMVSTWAVGDDVLTDLEWTPNSRSVSFLQHRFYDPAKRTSDVMLCKFLVGK